MVSPREEMIARAIDRFDATYQEFNENCDAGDDEKADRLQLEGYRQILDEYDVDIYFEAYLRWLARQGYRMDPLLIPVPNEILEGSNLINKSFKMPTLQPIQ